VRSERIRAGQDVALANGKRWGGTQKGRWVTVRKGAVVLFEHIKLLFDTLRRRFGV